MTMIIFIISSKLEMELQFLGVEFTAHVVFCFLTSLGTRDQRMCACIDRVFVPVIHGASSTLLGIFMLAFSEFEFVFKYFFVVMSALILIGVINGLILLPVLLSLIGPPCEVFFNFIKIASVVSIISLFIYYFTDELFL